jgi:hypothetical protein
MPITRTSIRVAAAGAAAVGVLASSGTALALPAPPEQHPRPDPTAACVLLPDPGSSGDKLYPAGDDTFTVNATGATQLDVLANDCANSTPGTTRSWSSTPPVTPAQFAAGDFSHPAGEITGDDQSLIFTPNAGTPAGELVLTYQWWETGDEEDHAWQGPYTGRSSTTATVLLIVPATSTPSPTPTPTPTPTGKPTPGTTGTAIGTSVAASAPAVHRAVPAQPATPEPELANTGARPTTALGAGLVALLSGVGLSWLAGRRPRRAARGAR